MANEFSKFAWMKAVERFDLNATEHAVLMHICNKADGTTGERAYVTDPGMAEAVNRSEKSIRRATKRLRDLGLIERTQRGIQGTRPSAYRLTMPPEVTGHVTSNRTSVTGHLDGVTGHSCPSNRTSMSGVSDPVTRSPKGSGSKEPDPPDIDPMSGVDAPRPVGEGQEQSEPSPWGSVSSIEGSDPKESEPAFGAVSSSTASTPSGVPEPDTDVSGSSNRTSGMSVVADEPSTESEAMKIDKTDPWATYQPEPSPWDVWEQQRQSPQPSTAAKPVAAPSFDPPGSWLGPQWAGFKVVPIPDDAMPPRPGQPGYAGRKAVYISQSTGEVIGTSPQPPAGGITFQMGSNQFVGPETDPVTGGPNWDQGPRQLPSY